MTLPELSIKRSVFAWMVGVVFILFGVIGYTRIPVQKMPSVNLPIISIEIDLAGADPNLINQTITQRVEKVMNKLQGIKTIHSLSQLGKAQIELDFNYGTDLDVAITQVQSALNQIANLFPANTKPPIIQLAAIDSDPIMLIAIDGHQTLAQLSQLAHQEIQQRLAGISGVADAEIVGIGPDSLQIVMNLQKMAQHNVTADDIIDAFHKHDVNIPGGYISNQQSRFVLDLDAEFHSPLALEKLVVLQSDVGPVYLGDIAQINYGPEANSGQALYNNQPAIGISITKKPDANTIDVVNSIKAVLKDQVKPLLPTGTNYNIIYESATQIHQITHELERDIWLSIFTAGIIIFFFLMSFRATGIVATAIPVSLLGAVAMIYFLGYSFNIITLLGLILLVGIVVDDAIIVLENIYRHMLRENSSSKEIAMQATKEVTFAVLASSLTLISIFLPIIFLQGELSLFFKSFAVVVASGVIISLIVSMTMTPMLCSKFLQPITHDFKITNKVNGWIKWAEAFYKRNLIFSLQKPMLISSLLVLVIIVAIPAYSLIQKEFIPAEPERNVFQIAVYTPEGSSDEYVQNRMAALTQVLKAEPGIKSYFSTVTDAGKGNITVTLQPADKRLLSQKSIVKQVTTKMHRIPGAIYILQTEDEGEHITFQIRGNDLNETMVVAKKVATILSKHPQLGSFYMHTGNGAPNFKIKINHDLISKYKLSTIDVLNALASLSTHGLLIGYFNQDISSPRAEVNLQTQSGEVRGENDLHKLMIRNSDNTLINLDMVVQFVPTTTFAEITRDDLKYSVDFTSTPTISMEKASKLIQHALKNKLPQGYELAMTGDAASLSDTLHQMKFAVFLIIVLMYIVLAIQFNSFIQPLIVLLAVPLAVVGGLLFLWCSTLSLNIYSMIGMLLLMGLVAKNSILLIDLTNRLRETGKSIHEALLIACPIRMRPIMMTSLAIIGALLPAALLGSDDSHRGLAVVIIGGMISSTLLSLIVVPVAYQFIETWVDKFKFQP